MERIKDYRIISSDNRNEFENKVIKMMEQGWRLQGGVFIQGFWFYQAMYLDVIKY